MTDVELLAMHRQGDESAFADLVRRHLGWVCGLARRRLRDAHRAEDVAQAVFVLLHRKAPVFATDGAMIGWLHKAAWYAAESAAREDRRRQKRETEAAEMKMRTAEESDVQWEQLAPILDDFVERLSRPDREAILLRYYRDLSFAEVAAQIGTTPDAARKRVERAIEKLRSVAQGKGLTLTAAALPALLAAHVKLIPPPGLVATATVTATAHAGSALALSTGSVVNGAIIMMSTKQLAVAGAAAVIFLLIGGGTIATTAWLMSKDNKPSVMVMPAPAPLTTDPQIGPQPRTYTGATNVQLRGGNLVSVGDRGMPFSAIRWRAADPNNPPEIPEVYVSSNWYELVAINDQPVSRIIAFSKTWSSPADWQRRFIEDLSDILKAMNQPAGPVKLSLLTLTDHKSVDLANVAMDPNNRSLIMFGKTVSTNGTQTHFSAVRWNDNRAEVQVNDNDTWYELLAVGDHTSADLFAFAQNKFGDAWKTHIETDSISVTKAMGDPTAATVMLKLRDLTLNE
jgi:RNA polymerase sigma factor (sigma-70 family)